MSRPLRLISALAFTHAPEDLLALAGEAMTPMLRQDGQMMWQFTRTVTRAMPPASGSYFEAATAYPTGAYDGGGTMRHWTASVRLSVAANTFQSNGQTFAGFTLDFNVMNGDSQVELLAMVTCRSLTHLLVARQWIAETQTPGFWQLVNRGWSDYYIIEALTGGQHGQQNLALALARYGIFPWFDRQDASSFPQAVTEAMRTRRLFNQ